MASTFTPNIQWEEPARGDDVGTWDTPVNNNGTLIDRVTGAQAGVPLNNSNVVLSAAQFQSKLITFSSTLTGSVTITFPSSFVKSYEIYNICTGSSAFTITLATTVAGGQVICAPPGDIVDVISDGANLRYKNLGRVGTYWEYGGSSVPAWVSGCSVLPYLNCDGTTFSSATFPQLANVLGGTTLPDARGRFRLTLNQGTGRVTTANGGMDGNTNLAGGGTPNQALVTGNLPPQTPSGTISAAGAYFLIQAPTGGSINIGGTGSGGTEVSAASPNINFVGTAFAGQNSQSFVIVNPAYTGGITMIRSA